MSETATGAPTGAAVQQLVDALRCVCQHPGVGIVLAPVLVPCSYERDQGRVTATIKQAEGLLMVAGATHVIVEADAAPLTRQFPQFADATLDELKRADLWHGEAQVVLLGLASTEHVLQATRAAAHTEGAQS